MILVMLVGVLVLAGGPEVSVGDTGDLDVLRRLVESDGAEYRALRREALEERRTSWDVAKASRKSWKLGVIAFALNARQLHSALLQEWDKQVPKHRVDGTRFSLPFWHASAKGIKGFSQQFAVQAAFLLEKYLKSGPQGEGDLALGDLYSRIVNQGSACDGCNNGMWRSIWEQCPNGTLREISLFCLCSSGDAEVLDIIASVLQSDDDGNTTNLKIRCLSGLWYSKLPETARLVLDEWDKLDAEPLLRDIALGVLATSPDPEARQVVYRIALDPQRPPKLRLAAVVRCSRERHANDLEFLRQFLSEVGSAQLKRDVVSKIGGKFPIEWVRLVLREILADSEDTELIGAAALGLRSAHRFAKDASETDKDADAALLEDVLRRHEDLAPATRVHIQMYIEGLRAKPGDPRPRLSGPRQKR